MLAMHKEDVKAAIRKRFRSVRAFEAAHGLPDRSVSDLLRGRRSRRVEEAVLTLLATSDDPSRQSEVSDHSAERARAHPMNRSAA